jgi:hypothetical protein
MSKYLIEEILKISVWQRLKINLLIVNTILEVEFEPLFFLSLSSKITMINQFQTQSSKFQHNKAKVP